MYVLIFFLYDNVSILFPFRWNNYTNEKNQIQIFIRFIGVTKWFNLPKFIMSSGSLFFDNNSYDNHNPIKIENKNGQVLFKFICDNRLNLKPQIFYLIK